jgi:hypothetical protein
MELVTEVACKPGHHFACFATIEQRKKMSALARFPANMIVW